jgi:hypothetical protein
MLIEELEVQFPGRKGLKLHYTTPEGEDMEFLALRPNKAEYEKFLSDSFDSEKRVHALKNLATVCIKVPNRKDFQAFCGEYPGCPLSLAGSLLKAAGATGEATLVLKDEKEVEEDK